MRVLITGICGFVGSVIASELVRSCEDIEIVGMDNLVRPGSQTNLDMLKRLQVKLWHGDIRCCSDFEVLPKLDYIIDAAANPSVLAGVDGLTSSRQLVEHNLSGTVNLLELCKRDRAGFILLSTSRVYSIAPLSQLPVLEQSEAYVPDLEAFPAAGVSLRGVAESFSTLPPLSLYGTSKCASELLALEYGSAFEFPVWINRCGVLAGAGQFGRPDQGIYSYWIHSWCQRQPLKYIGFNGKGYQVRDCLHPKDIACLLIKQMAYRGNDKNRIQNISGGIASSTSLAQLSSWCESRFGQHEVLADPLQRPFDIPWMVLDYRLAQSQWGWTPQMAKETIFEEIAIHAELNPNWLSLSAPH